MFYREKKVYAGKFMDVDVFPCWPQPGKKQRRKKAKPTSIIQDKLNAKTARKKLERLMNNNFSDDDIEVHLSYAVNPETDEQAKKDVQNYIRKIKRMRSKAGLDDLRYICVMERSEAGRYHFHITMSGGLDRDAAEQAWKHGRGNSRRLQADQDGLAALSSYMFVPEKEEQRTKGRRRWWGSRNLAKPMESVNDYKYSKRAVAALAAGADHQTVRNLYPGYICLNVRTLYNDVNGGIYLTIELRKDDAIALPKKKRKKREVSR